MSKFKICKADDIQTILNGKLESAIEQGTILDHKTLFSYIQSSPEKIVEAYHSKFSHTYIVAIGEKFYSIMALYRKPEDNFFTSCCCKGDPVSEYFPLQTPQEIFLEDAPAAEKTD